MVFLINQVCLQPMPCTASQVIYYCHVYKLPSTAKNLLECYSTDYRRTKYNKPHFYINKTNTEITK